MKKMKNGNEKSYGVEKVLYMLIILFLSLTAHSLSRSEKLTMYVRVQCYYVCMYVHRVIINGYYYYWRAPGFFVSLSA